MLRWQIGGVRVTRFQELELPGLRFILPEATPENLGRMPWLAPHSPLERIGRPAWAMLPRLDAWTSLGRVLAATFRKVLAP